MIAAGGIPFSIWWFAHPPVVAAGERLGLGAILVWLLPVFVGVIVFTGVYPKPILDRIEPSVKALLEHVEQHTTYRQPLAVIEVSK